MIRSVLRGVLAAIVLLSIFGFAGLGSAFDGQAATEPGAGPVERFDDHSFSASSSQEFDSTTFEIVVYDNGTAEWTFRHERILSDESEEAAFEEFAEEFESEDTPLYDRFTDQAIALTESGADETDREMEATDFDRAAYVDHRPNAMGIVEMSFLWHEFAVVDDDGVTVSDVFDGGLYVGSDQALVVYAGDELRFDRVQPDGEYTASSLENAESITWSGEREFIDGQPMIVFDTPDENDQVGVVDAGDEDGQEQSMLGLWLALFGLGILVVGVIGAIVWRHRGGRSGGDVAVGDRASATRTSRSDDTISEEELLTDEDRVVELIRRNGGRMKQVNIVDETGWSKSKVSMLLSEMEEEGTISKLRVGRENIISLDGFEPEATKSPLDE